MNDKDDGIDIVDMFKKASEFVEDNEDMVRDILPSGNTVDIDDHSPLTSAIVDEDEVIVTVEARGSDFGSVNIKETDSGAIIGMNEQTIEANIPDDADVSDADVMLNNGVLEVTFPRKGGGE